MVATTARPAIDGDLQMHLVSIYTYDLRAIRAVHDMHRLRLVVYLWLVLQQIP